MWARRRELNVGEIDADYFRNFTVVAPRNRSEEYNFSVFRVEKKQVEKYSTCLNAIKK
jgi:hypothetical protein